VIGLLFSPALFILCCWEICRYQHGWRTILAAAISLLASFVAWQTLLLRIAGKL